MHRVTTGTTGLRRMTLLFHSLRSTCSIDLGRGLRLEDSDRTPTHFDVSDGFDDFRHFQTPTHPGFQALRSDLPQVKGENRPG